MDTLGQSQPLLVLVLVLVLLVATTEVHALNVDELVRRWAPLVWLDPGERYFPSGVPEFLGHVTPRSSRWQQDAGEGISMPKGGGSESWFLVTNTSLDALLANRSSFLHGRDPRQWPVPVYALVTPCDVSNSSFYVTYWLFYPYSQGKPVCTLDLGFLGAWPLPLLNGRCLGTLREFGAHVGDWEHVSLSFQKNSSHPDAVYVSAHDAGAFYRVSLDARRYVLERQEVRRGGELQMPAFPASLGLTAEGRRLELFAARGSHGLWASPGAHRYVRLPRLYDHGGYGVAWPTWRELHILRSESAVPGWMGYRGRWGNPRSRCHPLATSICEISDGPTGIPMKKHHFQCANTS